MRYLNIALTNLFVFGIVTAYLLVLVYFASQLLEAKHPIVATLLFVLGAGCMRVKFGDDVPTELSNSNNEHSFEAPLGFKRPSLSEVVSGSKNVPK